MNAKKESDSARVRRGIEKNPIAALYYKDRNVLGDRKVCNIKDRQRGCATPSLFFLNQKIAVECS
jgi:hypothetical protein